jgi:uncharacterized protein with von Willebrand factor type A (vWA) domain
MFVSFFYEMKNAGIPVSPTAFLTLHRAFSAGLVGSLEDFYITARTVLLKSERYFDLFDEIFAHHFHGAEMPETLADEMDEAVRMLLGEWLKDPRQLSDFLGVDEETLAKLSPEELEAYFKARMLEQTERHDGGNKWIGTGGTSPVGHSGFHPGGMRVGGISRNKSAIKVAMERRYKDYSIEKPLTRSLVGEAMKRLRHMRPEGPRDQVNVDATITNTIKNGGEIEIVFDRRLKDRLKVVLAIDNGGWSMDPHVAVVQTLFDHAGAQFKELKTLYFHNTVYDTLWAHPSRMMKPVALNDLTRLDPETRLIMVGDASMAPWELMFASGSIYYGEKTARPSIECLRFLAQTFPHNAWLNPVPQYDWGYTRTIIEIAKIFPMFELTLDGLEKAVARLMAR